MTIEISAEPDTSADLLVDFELFRTRDPLEAQEEAVPVTAPHKLKLRGREDDFDASVRCAAVGDAYLCVLQYGAEIVINRPGYDYCVSVLVPLSGHLAIEQRGREYIALPHQSMVVLSPGHGAVHMRWSPGTTVMALKADTAGLVQALRWIAPRADDRPFTATSPQLAGPALRPIFGVAQLFTDVFSAHGRDQRIPPPLARQLREQTLSTLWLSVPNNHTETIYGRADTLKGSRVRQALDIIAAESRAEHTVADLARAVNVGTRALELAFRRELDESPLRYLLRTRMERAHEELLNSDPHDVTVTEVALKWGFSHLGRFATRYRAQYGVMPSSTLNQVLA